MEGMEMGWDGSRGCVAMGHDFISVSIVGAEHKDAVPLYMKLGKGRHCKEELLYDAIDRVMEKTDGKGWIIKLLGDNVETLAFKIHSLLSAVRELYLKAKVRFITGRPRKAEKSDSAQMFFVLEKRLKVKKSTTKKKGYENKFS